MSASLVGSEMCIRDRSLCTSDPPGYHNTMSAVNWALANMQPMLKSFVPVSYTHLTLPTICSV
eukprot:4006385-Alexandrium_andersonii.AAC.1